MHCTQCGAATSEDAKFCGDCGAPLGLHCKTCGHLNPRKAESCGGCGASFVQTPKAVAERRHLTIFFVDLVGSTALAESMDPEELREIYGRYRSVCGDAIRQYDGHIAQFLGDGILAYFGYPNAHEDDAFRAVRAGLDILRRVDTVATAGVRPNVRIGVHTGLVVVEDVSAGQHQETLALGKAPNVAARVQSEADPDSMLISEATRRLVAGSFRLEDLGQRALRGVSQPLQLWRVEGLSDAASRFDALAASGLTPFVGREQELETIRDTWSRAQAGSGQAILLRGEAGIGKSRLIGATRDLVSEHDHVEFAFECSPYHATSAFYPITQMLERRLGISEQQPAAERIRAIEGLAHERDPSTADCVPLLASLLGVPVEGHYEEIDLTPTMLRYRTLGALTNILLGANGLPTLVVMEDLHWADPSTLELVTAVVAGQADRHMMVIASTRPDLPQLWSPGEDRLDYEVEALPTADTQTLVEGVIGGKSLPEEVLKEIVARTGGIPLFIEAVTRTVIEAGVLEELEDRYELTGPLPKGLIPSTVHDSLMARVDMLGDHKPVAQLAATIGRDFGQQLLLELSGMSNAELDRALKELIELELVSRSGFFPDWTYTFKHALLRDAAYESLLRKTRQEYHGKIGECLRDRFPEVAAGEPELLARHFEAAGRFDEAIEYVHRAGQQAMERGAHSEAMAAFEHGIGLMSDVPPTADRHRHELALRASMGGSLIATKGYCAPEFEENAVRSRELCEQLGTPPELAPVLYSLWVLNLASSRRVATERYAQELLDFTQTLPEGILHVSAWFAQGTTHLYRGRFEAAREAFERALHFWSPDMHGELVRTYGDDHGLFSQVYLQWLHLFVGQPSKARALMASTVVQAERFADPLAEVLALDFGMIVHHDMREWEPMREFADRTIDLSTRQGFPFWRANGLIGRGLLRVLEGEHEAGLEDIEGGVGFFHIIAQKLPLTYWTSYLVEAHLAMGEHAKGLEVVDELLEMSAMNVDSFFEPELWRLRGALLEAADPGSSEALGAYRKAIAVAQDTGAAFYELRAANSAARLLDVRGDGEAGRDLVVAAMAKITDGDDLADMREAAEFVERTSGVDGD